MSCQIGYYLSSTNQCESICGDGIVAVQEQCDHQQLSCYNCRLICDLACLDCSYGKCRQCSLGYFVNSVYQCQTICGDKIAIGSEQCDDGNFIPYDGCWNCQYDCPINCQFCTKGECIQCQSGYYNNYNQCASLCGDAIVVGNEQCDDGNVISNDGCFNCHWNCMSNCQICVTGICQQCQTGYYLVNQQCLSICGDQIIAADEYCDDGNSYPFDDCAYCQKSCTQECVSCLSGFCQSCQLGYYVYNNKCITYCGDMTIAGLEQCDDGNLDLYDGCYNCTIGCPYATFLNDNNKCTNICGDGLVATDFEQCDDANIINSDGCSHCIIDKHYVCVNNLRSQSICYLCPLNCNICQVGKCYQCFNGYFLTKGYCAQCDQSCITCQELPTHCIQAKYPNSMQCNTYYGYYPNFNASSCYSICGDSIKTSTEQCDDGNTLSGDGCNSFCQIENGWSCNDLSPSYCTTSILPILQNTLQQSPSLLIQELIIQISVPCFLFNNINTSLSILSSAKKIEITQSERFNKTNIELQTISYLVQLMPQENINHLQLDILLPSNTFKTNESFLLQNMTNKIVLQNLYYVSPTAQAIINQVNNCNNYLIYGIIGVGVLSFLMGQLEPVLNMLDLMQYLSYLQYIDIDFPYLLTTYFDIYSIVSMDLLISNLGFTNFYEYPIVKTSHKFDYYGVNGYFLANFQSSLYVLVISYSIFFLLKILESIIYGRENLFQRQFYLKLQYQLMRLIHKSNNFHFSGLIQLILSSFYDLSFAVLLFLSYHSLDNCIVYLYLFITFFIIAILLIIVILALIKSTKARFYHKLKCFLEGLKRKKQNIHIKSFTFYLLVKKSIFCFLIVFLQGYGKIQTISISMNSLIFICYFSYFKPLVNNMEHIKIVLTEVVICIGTLTFLSYTFLDNYQIIEIVQWAHVFSLTFALLASLVIDIKQLCSKSCPGLMNYMKNAQHKIIGSNPQRMKTSQEPLKYLYKKVVRRAMTAKIK